MKKLRITIEGKAYDVTVDVLKEGKFNRSRGSRSRPAASVGASPVAPVPTPKPQAAAAVDGSVVSPLAGKIVSIAVQTGQAVKEGDELITMEAMKMNTHVFAPQDGTIGKILVSDGDAVEEGQPLIEMS